MIGHQQQRPFAERRQLCEHRTEDRFVDPLERLDLVIGAAHVAGLVGRFDVEQEEVAPFERVEPKARLGRVVGIEKAGRTGNGNHFETGEPSEAVDEIDRRMTEPSTLKRSLSVGDGRALALSPEPHGRHRRLARVTPRLVHWMGAQDLGRAAHQRGQAIGDLPFRQVRARWACR